MIFLHFIKLVMLMGLLLLLLPSSIIYCERRISLCSWVANGSLRKASKRLRVYYPVPQSGCVAQGVADTGFGVRVQIIRSCFGVTQKNTASGIGLLPCRGKARVEVVGRFLGWLVGVLGERERESGSCGNDRIFLRGFSAVPSRRKRVTRGFTTISGV